MAGATLAAAAPSTVTESLLLRKTSFPPERVVEPAVARGTAPSAITSNEPPADRSVTAAMSKVLSRVAPGASDAKASSVSPAVLVRRRTPLKAKATPSLKTVALSTGAVSRKVPDLRNFKASAPLFLTDALITVPPAEERVTATSDTRFSRSTATDETSGMEQKSPRRTG